MKDSKKIDPIVKNLELNCSIDHAFNVFTDKMDLWWPLKSHSCFEENSAGVKFEKKVGGKVVEISKSGETSNWGKLLAWDPPHLFSMTWHPANAENLATKLTVRFDKISEAKTKLSLFHEGWEIRGDQGKDIRGNYDSGWDQVLSLYQTFLERNEK